MCGIAGSIGSGLPAPEQLSASVVAMRHRGPDAKGTWTGKIGRRDAALVHTRLSIIDLDPRSNQPFEWEDCVVSYNGEIYNYVELRAALETR